MFAIILFPIPTEAMILQNFNNSYLMQNMFEITNVTVSLNDQEENKLDSFEGR